MSCQANPKSDIYNMTSWRDSIKRLNWRQILIHFLASCSFTISFKYLLFLYDIRLFKIIQENDSINLQLTAIKRQNIGITEIMNYVFFSTSYWLWAVLLAFLISLFISLRKHWFWVNSMLSFIGVVIIYKNPLERRPPERDLNTIYHNLMPLSVGYCIAIGILFLAIGLWMFFSRSINNFIASTIQILPN